LKIKNKAGEKPEKIVEIKESIRLNSRIMISCAVGEGEETSAKRWWVGGHHTG